MDTKSKKSKAFKIWLCFFLGINIVGLFIIGGLLVADEFDMAMLGSDVKETQNFKHTLAIKFDTLARYITDNLDIPNDIDEDNEYGDSSRREEIINVHMAQLRDEGENLIYYAKNPKTDKIFTNLETEPGILPEGYDFYIFYNGEKFSVEKDGKPVNIYHRDNGYRDTLLRLYLEHPDSYVEQGEGEIRNQYSEFYDIRDCQVFLAVKENIVENPYGYSSFYDLQKQTTYFKWVMVGVFVVFTIGIGLLTLSIIKRKYKREFEEIMGKVLGRIFLELKIVASFMFMIVMLYMDKQFYYIGFYHIAFFMVICFWWLYIVWIDLRTNGARIFTNNIVNGLIQKYRVFERKRPFQKALLLRLYTLVGLEILLIIFTGIFLLVMFASGNGGFFFVALAFVALGIYFFYRYVRRYTNTIDDIGKIIDQTVRIRQGDMQTKLELSPDGDLHMIEENLNTIQEGIARAVEDSVKSERMKVELITNISHDLKTPLTSIISYVDLLSKEENLPEHLKDYIKILAQKSERLKLLIQDLFDLSKAVSGEMEFEMKTLDLGKLIEQTLGDLEDKISDSRLIFRVNIPDSPVPIISDGNKLYRVFLNLFLNTLKYSLVGTRVYVDLINDNGKAIVTIKNTANYEMNFSEEEIIERFVRGDKARSSEGSGLGLAIAQNFTRACGGGFDIKVDGDLFKVILSFDKKLHKDIENDHIK